MHRSIPFLVATMVLAVLAAPSDARQKRLPLTGKCLCACITPNYTETGAYNMVAACSAYNGKTCNIETPGGLIRTGKLDFCVKEIDPLENFSTGGSKPPASKPPKPKAPPPPTAVR